MNLNYKNNYITFTLIGINIAVFLLMTVLGGSTNSKILILFGAKVNALIDMGQYWRLFTSIFIHIGFTHLLFNSYALFVLGMFGERMFGHFWFLFLYLISGLGGSSASYFCSPYLSAGASGAIFGLLGAIIVYGWKNTHLWRSGLITSLLMVLGINLVFGLLVPGIDNFAHVGGLVTGGIVGLIIKSFKKRRN